MSADATVPWHAVFGNERPVEVEIGPGNGDVLLAFARAAPSVNFFGIERTLNAADAISRRAARRGLANVRAIAGDARCIVAQLVPPASVTAYHVYFPDPWPKTRHRARRLAGDVFAAAVHRTLVPAGTIEIATDLPAVRDAFSAALARAGLVACPPGQVTDRPRTIFERKYARGGTHHARFVRRP